MAFKDVVVIGQYIPTNSVLHRAMAETKIVMTLFFIIGAFISSLLQF